MGRRWPQWLGILHASNVLEIRETGPGWIRVRMNMDGYEQIQAMDLPCLITMDMELACTNPDTDSSDVCYYNCRYPVQPLRSHPGGGQFCHLHPGSHLDYSAAITVFCGSVWCHPVSSVLSSACFCLS
ncbi:MAG: hypothetical protein ACLR0U_30755 [Enterocloster clostridioformis]